MSDIVTTGGGRGVLAVIPDNIFYVDATNGDDSATGLLGTPWKIYRQNHQPS